ncbi:MULTISPECIES: A24 family peptidase [Clostridium]|uniref:Prepilin peptidase n=2 Tax=Clostridium cibarium TaxID=2762247 RepID=A0ABR8PU24_9CLOT|nr:MULTISPECIES: A24 family peptidase [Clostridium]MBD7911682.1 prepilin peptidase [Clostridium cibarium]
MNIILFIILIGLSIGSFLNVCICRIPNEESISFPPSHCTSCGYKLKFYDLIPVLSYFILKGRCRKCKEKISIQYPLVEITNAILYVALYIKFGCTFEFIKYSILLSILVVIGIIDLQTQYVYRITTIVGAVSGGVFFIIKWKIDNKFPGGYALGAIIGFFIIYIIVKVTGGMGEGDIEIATICGLFLGIKQIIFAIFISFVTGGVVGLMYLIFKLKGRKDEIAFGPYLVLGTITAIFFGVNIINWYISLC